MSPVLWAGVALLGGVGAVVRFVIDGAISRRITRSFPFGTMAINLSGALLLGVLVGAGLKGDALVLAGTATLGAYTTFSTWMLETHRLAEDGDGRAAALNVALSVALGIAAATLGHLIGAWA